MRPLDIIPAYRRGAKLTPRSTRASIVVIGKVSVPLWEKIAARLNPLHSHRCQCRGGQSPHDGPGCGPCACGHRIT